MTYPIDLLRRRLQLQGIGGEPKLYTGPFNAISTIIKNDGFFALYRGMIPCYLLDSMLLTVAALQKMRLVSTANVCHRP